MTNDHRIEIVQWIDACGPDCVTTLHAADIDALAPLVTTDVGFLVKEDDICVVLAPQVNAESGIRRPICIPKVCIIRRARLFAKKGK